MTSIAPSSFEMQQPQSHQGIHASPHPSPHIQRPSSQASFHLNNGGHSYSPQTGFEQSPMSAYPGSHAQTFKIFTPTNLSLPLPHQSFASNYPSTAPPLPYYPDSAPIWDARISSQPMIRTVSQGHPMHSATEHTASSRYSSSPHSATHDAPPPTAGGGYPSINPAVFNSSYSMSRSTSGASDTVEYNARLLTPHADYRPLGLPHTAYSPQMSHDLELRKMSDSLGRMPSSKFMPQSFASFAFDHASHLGPHPQPDVGGGGMRGWGNEFALSAERGGDTKVGIHVAENTDYERAREEQIVHNKKLMEEMGLGHGGGAFGRSRSVTYGGGDRGQHSTTPIKKRVASEAPGESSSWTACVACGLI